MPIQESLIQGLVIDENKLVEVMIEKQVPERISQSIIDDFMEYKILDILPMKYLIITSTILLIIYRWRLLK